MKRSLRLLFFFLVSFACQRVMAQVVAYTPVFPTDTDVITITYDASLGNGALANVSGPVYAHTGVITNLSTSETDWRYVKNPWTTNNANTLMEPLGDNKYRISFPIRAFYGVPAGEQILKLAFVFRNSDRSRVGRAANGADIYIPVHQGGLAVKFTSPDVTAPTTPIFLNQNEQLTVSAAASAPTALSLFLNDTKIKEEAATTSISATITATQAGSNRVRVEAAGGTPAEAFFYFVVRQPSPVQALPANAEDGVTYVDANTVILNLYAPGKQTVYAIGDFNNWQVGPHLMNRTPDGDRFWIRLTGLEPGKEYRYQYLVDENIRIGDPYAQKVLDPFHDPFIPATTYPDLTAYPTGQTTGTVTVFQTAQTPYNWRTTDFQPPAKTDLVIYELLLRDFLAAHNFQTLRDTLDYLQRLGVNAIELMPINEFEGNESWGYNPSYYFAPDKYYGPKNALKALVDEAHARGIAVILDMVLNHSFGQSPMVQLYFNRQLNRPAADNPWFNEVERHPFNVGYDFNHESPATQYFVDRVNEFWIEEYRVDGFRFDLSKGFTQRNTLGNEALFAQYDQSRIDLLKRMAAHIWEVDPDTFIILEHFADNSEERVLAENGMMLWGNLNHNYNEATMGYTNGNKADLSWGSYKQRGWSQPNLVTYMESHDEERLMVKNLLYGNSSGSYNTKNPGTALERMELAAAFFFTIPGPKMIWQFGELGYDFSINRCPDGTISNNCRLAPKPLGWQYLQDPNRQRLFNVYAGLIRLKINQPVFETENFTLNVGGTLKSIHLSHPTMNVTVIGNFGVTAGSINPQFQAAGTWHDYITGASIDVNNPTAPVTLQPGEYHVYTSVRLNESGILTASPVEEELASRLALTGFPNPSDAETTLRFVLPAPAEVTLEVYNLLGQRVKTLQAGRQRAGTYEVPWDLRSESGSRVGSGVYLARLKVGNQVRHVRLLVQ